MIGQLPTKLEINGTYYRINPDYRNILTIISAFSDNTLSDNEKSFILLYRLFPDFKSIPENDYAEACKVASLFIDSGMHSNDSDKKHPRIVDWEHDEQIIFSAVNRVAGRELRECDNLHWWSFMGYYQAISHDDLFGLVVSIRQKRAKGHKLEKYETDFLNANRSMCEIPGTVAHRDRKREAEDYLAALYKELTEGGEDNG